MALLLNTLYITTPDAYLRLEGETVCVMLENVKKLQVPLHHIGSLVLFDHVMLSPALLGRCAEEGRSVVWLDRVGHFRARLEGPVSGNILLRKAQHHAAVSEEKTLNIARFILAGKLRNSRQIMIRAAREADSAEERESLSEVARYIGMYIRKLPVLKDLETLRGYEGDAAKRYFGAIPILIKPAAREQFPFSGRNRRPPRDAFNALISFLYALVLSDCRAALETTGLDPQLGFLHVVRPGRPALALDILEEFRAPLADRLALTLVNRSQIQIKHFEEREGGTVLLNDEGRKTVIASYQARKQETIRHPILETDVMIGLLPQIQARLLARYIRGDVESYVPYLLR
jgi:CRISPR-associated protein Cas1